ncbi:hypothetical protein KAH37_00020 [bacterium]|nr:hypothetical protein [bacterium]
MKKLSLLVILALLFGFGCTKSKTVTDEVNEYVQKYLYTIRDTIDSKKGTVKGLYDSMLSEKMKEAITLEEYKNWLTERYKGKIGKKLRTAYAQITYNKSIKDHDEAICSTTNEGRMAGAMNTDLSLVFNIRLIKENKLWKVEQTDLMDEITAEKDEDSRLQELLSEYKGLLKIEEITGKPIRDRKGFVELRGMILNASEDLDIVKAGIKLFFKDSSGDVIYATKFTPVIDMRYEGLRTSLLPGRAQSFISRVKDVPETWDPEQPLQFKFYLIDGQKIDKTELVKEYKDRDKLKKLIEETKKADEEARKQLKEMWEREKALKAKIQEMQNQSKAGKK